MFFNFSLSKQDEGVKMKNKLLVALCVISLSIGVFFLQDYAFASDYGIYGTVYYPCGDIVASPTVHVYKYQGGQYVYHGSTTASACGYYTYDTGGTGNFRVYVSGTYDLRYAPCGSIFDNESVAGDNYGSITIWSPFIQLDIQTA